MQKQSCWIQTGQTGDWLAGCTVITFLKNRPSSTSFSDYFNQFSIEKTSDSGKIRTRTVRVTGERADHYTKGSICSLDLILSYSRQRGSDLTTLYERPHYVDLVSVVPYVLAASVYPPPKTDLMIPFFVNECDWGHFEWLIPEVGKSSNRSEIERLEYKNIFLQDLASAFFNWQIKMISFQVGWVRLHFPFPGPILYPSNAICALSLPWCIESILPNISIRYIRTKTHKNNNPAMGAANVE